MKARRLGLLVSALLHLGVVVAVAGWRERDASLPAPAVLSLATFARIAAATAPAAAASRETPVVEETPPPPAKVPPAPPKKPSRPVRETPVRRPPPPPDPEPPARPPPRPSTPVARAEPTVPVEQATFGAKADAADAPPAKGESERASAERSRYLAGLRRAIEARRRYPRAARRLGIEGHTTVAFVLQRDGRISDVGVGRGSGSRRLDAAAVAAVQAVGRYHPLPAAIRRDRWALSVELEFHLRDD